MGNQYGIFYNICKESGSAHSTIPICNLYNESPTKGGNGYGGCDLTGIPLSGDRHLANLGSIILSAIAVLVSAFLLFRSERKKAAVGRREIQLFLIGYILISILEILTIGGFPLNGKARLGLSAAHIGLVVATSWVLMLNGIVGYQLLDDGTGLSMLLLLGSAACFFIGTGYIGLDTAFQWTKYWSPYLMNPDGTYVHQYGLYTLYQIVPLLFLVIFFLLESYLVLRILGEKKPMLYLIGAAVLFAVGQVFQYVASDHICTGTHGKINGGLFEVLFTLLAVVMIWIFWSSITEDDWPVPATGGGSYT